MKDKAYYPSWTNITKYGKYFGYLGEYIKYNDWKSLRASLRYVMLNKPTFAEWESKSAMGKFLIRSGTTDFQFINYAYEKQVRDYLKEEAKSGNLDVFIDMGACIGEYCVWLGGMGVRSFAFEPVNHAAIHNNIKLNNVAGKVKVYACGLGNKKEKVHFNVMSTVTGSSFVDRENKGEGDFQIERFDDLFPTMGIDVNDKVIVKLDVEGMELEVLEGARDFITKANNLRVIFERYKDDNTVNDKLSSLAKFTFKRLDEFNYLATKAKG